MTHVIWENNSLTKQLLKSKERSHWLADWKWGNFIRTSHKPISWLVPSAITDFKKRRVRENIDDVRLQITLMAWIMKRGWSASHAVGEGWPSDKPCLQIPDTVGRYLSQRVSRQDRPFRFCSTAVLSTAVVCTRVNPFLVSGHDERSALTFKCSPNISGTEW